MLLEIDYLKVCDTCHTALRKLRVGLVESCLADETNFTLMRPCYLQGVAHAGNTGADNQKVVFENHLFCFFLRRCKFREKNEDIA